MDGEIVGLVHASRRERDGMRHVVVLFVFSIQTLTEPLHNKRSNS